MPVTRLTRRELLRRAAVAAGALGAAPLLGACASVEPAPGSAAAGAEPERGDAEAPHAGGRDFAGQTVTLLVYSGLTERLYRRHFVPQFSGATGADVVIDSAWTEGIARLQAAPSERPPFDLVLTDPTQGLPAIRAGLFQAFDTGRVPNAEQFAPRLLDTTVWREGYGLPFQSSSMTLATNTRAHPEPYQTWGQLLAEPPDRGVMLYNLPYMSLFTFAAMQAEVEEGDAGRARDLLESDIGAVLTFAVEHRDLVDYWWPSTTDGVNALVHGNVASGNLHGNGLLAPIRQGRPVAGVIPSGTAAYAQLFFAVPSGVPNLDLSLAALNHVASREFQRALASSGEYSCAIPGIAIEQAATDEVWAQAFPGTLEEFETLRYYPYEVYERHGARIAAVWDRDVLRGV